MYDQEISKCALKYVARGEADNGQFFTNPECKVFHGPEGFVCAQVWVAVPYEDLNRLMGRETNDNP